MQSNKKKIVFFYKKKHTIAGSLLMFLDLAKYIAENHKDYEVYYINYYNEHINGILKDSNIIFKDYGEELDENLENAIYLVPLNYIQVLLSKISNFKNAKIILLDWHPYLIDYLMLQFDNQKYNAQDLLQLLQNTRSVYFIDKSCREAVNRYAGLKYDQNYIPVFIDQNIGRYEKLPLVNKDRISIGWLGRLDKDKIYSIINLADNLLKSEIELPIDIHIVGDGNARNALKIEDYSPKIRFIYTSYLLGDDMYTYLKQNVDILVAMGMSALNGAELGIPTVIPIVSNSRFYTNKYVFLYDAEDFSLGWDKADLKTLGYKTYSIEEVIAQVLSDEDKVVHGKRCYEHLIKNHNIELAVSKMINALENSTLTVEKCLKCTALKDQQKEFSLMFQKGEISDFEEYVDIIKNRNAERNQDSYEKIKGYVKNVLWEKHLKKLLLLFKSELKKKKYLRIQADYPRKVSIVKEKLKENKKIKVAFIVLYEATFPARPIFEQMLQENSMFEPYVIVSADVQRSMEHRIKVYHSAVEFFENKYPGNVICGYNEEWDEFLELGEEYPIVFFSNPYIKMAHPYHEVQYFLDKNVLTLYVNYGFAAVKYGRNIMQLDFYNYIWKVFLDSEINRKDLKKYQPIQAKNAVVTSYIKMDELSKVEIVKRDRKKIIICPHHTVMGWDALDISNFLRYSELFVELPSLYPQIDFVFRPHPLLFNNLIANRIWKDEEVKDYLDRMLNNSNVTYDVSGDYFDTFMNGDAMIHDCSSFIGEYLFTEKPCCYMLKSEKQIEDVFLPMGKMCIDNYYKAFSREDILKFIDDVVIGEVDPLKDKREKFSREVLKFNYPHSAEFVVDYLKRQLVD